MLFALHMVRGVYPEKIPDREWNLFLGQTISKSSEIPIPNWVPSENKQSLTLLCSFIPQLQLGLQDPLWKNWMKDFECEKNIPV